MEILIGSNSPINHKIFWKGVLSDADSLPTVKIFDITEDPAISPPVSPTTQLASLTAEKSEIDPGTYDVYLPLSLTDRQRKLQLTWIYQVESNTVSKVHEVFVTKPYADIAQAMDALGVSSHASDPNYKSYAELCAAERWARKIIENYTGQDFYLYDDLYTVYGAGSDVLPLPYKLNDLHELYENDILLLDNINAINNLTYNVQVSETGFAIRVNKANMLDNTVYTANGMVPPSINDFESGVFRSGATYKVQGKYGWIDIPDEVELACIELMKDYFSNDKNWRNKYLKKMQSFDWNFEYNGDSFRGTGNVYVDQLLDQYVLTQMMVI
jgi:hypothetical protein